MSFADTVGVNLHLPDNNSDYMRRFSDVRYLLHDLGIRHVRDSAWPSSYAFYSQVHDMHAQLASDGISLDLVWQVNNGFDASLVQQIAGENLGTVLLEGPNERDVSGDANWVATTQAAMTALAASTPFPVIAPSFTSEAAFTSFGTAPGVSYGNLHAYMANRNPETAGWGATDAYGTYGSMAYNMNLAAVVAPGKPAMVTETGYDGVFLSEPTFTKYVLRTLLNNYRLGIARTYLYQLLDYGSDAFAHYGLVDADFNPRAAFTALKVLLRLLPAGRTSDLPGTAWFSPGMPAGVSSLVFWNGRNCVFLFWRSVASCDPDTGVPTTVAPIAVPIDMRLARPVQPVTPYSFDVAGDLVPGAAFTTGSVEVTDHVSVLVW